MSLNANALGGNSIRRKIWKWNHHWVRKLSHPPGNNLDFVYFPPNELNGGNFVKL